MRYITVRGGGGVFFFFFLFPARFETEAAGPRTAGVRPLLTQICLRYYKWFEAVGGGSGRPGLSHTARCISIRDSWPQGQLKQGGWRRGPGLRKSPIIVSVTRLLPPALVAAVVHPRVWSLRPRRALEFTEPGIELVWPGTSSAPSRGGSHPAHVGLTEAPAAV